MALWAASYLFMFKIAIYVSKGCIQLGVLRFLTVSYNLNNLDRCLVYNNNNCVLGHMCNVYLEMCWHKNILFVHMYK